MSTDIRSTLNDLIQTCKDGEEGFTNSAEHVKDPELRAIFRAYSDQRAGFATELQDEVAKLGGEPETSGSALGLLHRGWTDLKAAITGRDDLAVLEEAEKGEDAAVKAYREALAKDLPVTLQAVIETQYREIHVAHNNIRSLRDTGRMATTSASYSAR